MWYQDTELRGSGVQPERGRRQRRQRAVSQRPGSRWRVTPNRLTAFQGRVALGSGQQSLYLDIIPQFSTQGQMDSRK